MKRKNQTNETKFNEINNDAQGLHLRRDINRFYVSRKEGGRARTEYSADATLRSLMEYI